MGSQGLLLLMEVKFLIMMTRWQNILLPATITLSSWQATVMFCGLLISIKNFNSINSRRLWLPIFITHLFQHGLFWILGCNFFYTRSVLVGISFCFFLLLLPLFSFLAKILLCNNMIWYASLCSSRLFQTDK